VLCYDEKGPLCLIQETMVFWPFNLLVWKQENRRKSFENYVELGRLFYYKFFIRIYSLHRGGFLGAILIRLILYIIYIVPIVLPLSLLPTSLKAIARGFRVLFHIGIWSPSTIYRHFLHPPCSHYYPPHAHTVPILQSWFSLLCWYSNGCLNVCPF
jgi:hypothetical protein